MGKVLRCRDVGTDCDFEARGESEEEIMQKVAKHAKEEHGMEEIPEDMATQVRAAIRNE